MLYCRKPFNDVGENKKKSVFYFYYLKRKTYLKLKRKKILERSDTRRASFRWHGYRLSPRKNGSRLREKTKKILKFILCQYKALFFALTMKYAESFSSDVEFFFIFNSERGNWNPFFYLNFGRQYYFFSCQFIKWDLGIDGDFLWSLNKT